MHRSLFSHVKVIFLGKCLAHTHTWCTHMVCPQWFWRHIYGQHDPASYTACHVKGILARVPKNHCIVRSGYRGGVAQGHGLGRASDAQEGAMFRIFLSSPGMVQPKMPIPCALQECLFHGIHGIRQIPPCRMPEEHRSLFTCTVRPGQRDGYGELRLTNGTAGRPDSGTKERRRV